MEQLPLFASPAPARYLTVAYELPELDEKSGRPYAWTNHLGEAAALRELEEAPKRWPGVKVEVQR